MGAGLGSDVPFFLTGGLAMATGRGEIVDPLPDLADLGVVICDPQIESSTAEIYGRYSQRLRLTSEGPDARVDAFVAGSRIGRITAPLWQGLENDLEPVAIEKWPQVGRALDALKATKPLHAALTGSGSASFAVYPDISSASKAAAGLKRCWKVFEVATVGRERGHPNVGEIRKSQEEFA